MGTPGTLTRDDIGFSMPAHAPLFPRPPYDYKDASFLVFQYLTDAASAARMLPAQAELVETPDAAGVSRAVAGLVFASYPASTLGPYLEAVQYLACVYQGKPVQFATHLYVTTDVAMAAGREMGGYPKKIGDIRIEAGPPYTASLARPTGRRLVTATLTDLKAPEPVPADESLLKYLTLRLVPSPTENAAPSLAELLLSDWHILGGQKQLGTGTCVITGTSDDDPLHLAPVSHVFQAKLVRGTLRVTANDADPNRLRPF